jgi:predicted transcriptional regulator of viral defense system
MSSSTNKKPNRQTGLISGNPPAPLLVPGLLREAIPHEIFDYQTLLQCLQTYASPRDKITDLLEKKIIIRVKKGLYVFGQLYRRHPISREIIANLLYGPSYISLEYALQHHGLIPEGVETLTCVTPGRSRQFKTPVGLFTYRTIPMDAFRSGMDLVQPEGGLTYLMATPEKALADKLAAERGSGIYTLQAVQDYLYEGLRIPVEEISRLDPRQLERIASSYHSRRLVLLARAVEVAQRTEVREG